MQNSDQMKQVASTQVPQESRIQDLQNPSMAPYRETILNWDDLPLVTRQLLEDMDSGMDDLEGSYKRLFGKDPTSD